MSYKNEETETVAANVEATATETNANDAETVATAAAGEGDGKYTVMTRDEFERAKLSQNLPVGIISGIVAGVLCSVLWAAITVATEHQIGYMAIGVGAGVGLAMRFFGKGITKTFGVVGAVIALLSCCLGNILSLVGFISTEYDVAIFEVLSAIDASIITAYLKESFSAIDILFYALAISAGYGFAFKKTVVTN